MNPDQQAQAAKRLAAALRDSSASTMVRLALADYQRMLAGTASTPTDDRLTRASHEIARLSGQVAELERRLREAPAPLVMHEKGKCPDCGAPMLKDSLRRGSRCRKCFTTNSKWAKKGLALAIAAVNADPDRPFSSAGCWDVVAAKVGESVRSTRDAANYRGMTVHPRERRELPCAGCGHLVTERTTQGRTAALLCGSCQARRYRGAPLPLEVRNEQ